MISRKFIEVVKLSTLKSYQIAQKAGIHPSTLSRIVCGIEKVEENDERVLKVASVLKLRPEECFENRRAI